MNIHRLTHIHDAIAKDVWPTGVTLRCEACGHSEWHNGTDAARFLRAGWPTHCGRTMSTVAAALPHPEETRND